MDKKRQITVSAPGKLMLLGEHAVVYGRPCIVTAVGQRMQATVELTDQPIFQLDAPDVQVVNYQKPMDQLGVGEVPKGAKFVEIAVKNFFSSHPEQSEGSSMVGEDSSQSRNDKRGVRNDKLGVKITTSSEFSSQFGFGSSSAAVVCVVKALSELTQANLDLKAIFDLSYKTVLDIQGKGSGFDVAAAVFGGTLYFVTGGKVIEPLNTGSLPLIIGYSGIKADTVTVINQVAEKAKKFPAVIENIYNSIGSLVKQAKQAIINELLRSKLRSIPSGKFLSNHSSPKLRCEVFWFNNKDWALLGQLMNFNEGYLSALGVESKKLSAMIYAAKEAGAYGAKLSGAGMGDCMIALAPQDKTQAVKDGITEAGGQVIDIPANVEGVKIEE